jgi:hypothetical protein
MQKRTLSYYLFTSPNTPLDIASAWFEYFRDKGMAACVTVHEERHRKEFYNVWVEYDPVLFGRNVIPEKQRHTTLCGRIVESCGGFRERLDPERRLAVRHKYGPDPVILEELSKLGGEG